MTDADPTADHVRADLVEILRATRAAERDLFDTLTETERNAPAADGGWSPRDIQAHLAAWRQVQSSRLAAWRDGREPVDPPGRETDEVNAEFHAERADWPWDQVVADADATAASLIADVASAGRATLADERVSGSIMGNGPEHTIGHLAPVAERAGVPERIVELATRVEQLVAGDWWPSRPTAFARYNLACYHALAGRLDHARALLRLALPAEEELRVLAPTDDDLIALRDEIPALGG